MEFQDQDPLIKIMAEEVDFTAPAFETKTDAKARRDKNKKLNDTIQILHHNSEELIFTNYLSSPNHEIEPEVDPLAMDSDEFTHDPVKILPSSSNEMEKQEKRKRAKKTKLKTPDAKRSSSFSFIGNLPLPNFDGVKKRNQSSKINNAVKKHSSCSQAASSHRQTSVKDAGLQSLSLPFTCFECLQKFPTKPALKSHIDESHSKIVVDIRKPSTKRKLETNQNSEANSAPIPSPKFECRANGCSKVFLSPSALDGHARRSHQLESGVYFTCSQCPATFPQYRFLKEHMPLHVKASRFKCPLCSLNSKSEQALKNHLLIHNKNEKGTRETKFKKKLPAHKVSTSVANPWSRPDSEPRFQCDICVLSYLREGSLTKHIRKRSKDAPIKCTKCPEQFCTIIAWSTHLKSTHGTNPFECSHPGCFESFQVFHQLKAHTWKAHEREKIFRCSVEPCGRFFSRVHDLIIHQEMHDTNNGNSNSSQKYPCQVPGCRRSFKLKVSLYRHLDYMHNKALTGVPESFPCPVPTCGSILSTVSSRYQHMRSIHVGKESETFECRECKTSYKYALELLTHFEIHHEEELEGGDEIEPESESESEPDAMPDAVVKVEMEEEVDVKPKIKLEAGVDLEWGTLCEYPTDQAQRERENCGIMKDDVVVKVEDIKVEPDVDFFVD